MRAAVLLSVVFLSVAACQGPRGEPGPAGPPGPVGLTGATGPKSEGVDVPALMARVDMLEKKLAAAKVPHLVVIASGEDLGPALGADCAFSAKFGGEVCFTSRSVAIEFDRPDCAGTAFTNPGFVRSASARLIGIDRIYKTESIRKSSVNIQSRAYDGKCANDAYARSGLLQLADIGPVPLLLPEQVAIMDL